MSEDTTVFQKLIDDAVLKRIAPGFQAVVFDKDQILFSGISGYASAPSVEDPDGREMTPSTILWVASFCKVVTHIIALHAIERGFIQNFTMNDLDNHEKLVEILPELKQGSGTLCTKIIEGFEEPGPDGKKVMKLRDAKNKITLRMLLTHTTGFAGGAGWNNPLISQLFQGDDPIINNLPHVVTGLIKDFQIPLLFEPGTGFQYGVSTEWVAQFVVRGTGKNLRVLYKEFIVHPLSIPSDETDLWFPSSAKDRIASLHIKNADSPSGFIIIKQPLYTREDGPDEGHAYPAEGLLWATFRAFVPILQAMLRHDERILKKETWERVTKDDLKDRGITISKPYFESPIIFSTIDEYTKSTSPDISPGENMLSCYTLSGLAVGSYGWAGAVNAFFFLDPKNGIGGVLGTQMLPFMDSSIVEIRDKFENLIYETFVKKA
ncbi:hypothetical protein Clacol_006178 [Clathrus columnatus]|uniref:Beta-lactamase-related domain-containing protein n=1 Tax=Clathrus columnatus TaxID=1419009 RepID=A0AAV5AC77_9AGAM|nr:hypothetical protein Clacol_006178 [Clathrus columnatus]